MCCKAPFCPIIKTRAAPLPASMSAWTKVTVYFAGESSKTQTTQISTKTDLDNSLVRKKQNIKEIEKTEN